MAACRSLQHIFETPLPESPSNLLQSFTPWNHLQPPEASSFTEIFGELHFKENTDHSLLFRSTTSSSSLSSSSSSSSLSSSSLTIDFNSKNLAEENNERNYSPIPQRKHYRNTYSFSSMNSESLSLCTEGLGLESCDDTEDIVNNNDQKHRQTRSSITRYSSNEYLSGKRSRITGGEFPPPISCIGRSGKPWVCFKSYRQNGRFVLKEVKIPTQEFLHACREDGRLKLQYIQSDGEITEEDEENDEDGEDSEDEHAKVHNHVSDLGEGGEETNSGEYVQDTDRCKIDSQRSLF